MTTATQTTGVADGKPAPKKRGRPSTYDPAVADQIIEQLSDGTTLRAICRKPGMPKWRTVYDWCDAHEDFAARFARAREVGHDAIAEDSLLQLSQAPKKCATQFGEKVDSGYVQWQKNRAEQALKLLAKWNPKRYGEKLQTELAGAGGGPIAVAATVGLVAAPELAQVEAKIKQRLGLA